MATQEIGIPLDFSKGSFNNTVLKDGKLQLIELGKDDTGNIIYVPEGYWISEAIRIADKVSLFKYVAKTISGTGTYTIYTQSSQDSYTWTDWEIINGSTGSISTPVGYYARVKVVIVAVNSNVTLTVDEFNVVNKYDNSYVSSANGLLELRKSYSNRCNLDSSWTGEGKMLNVSVQKTNFKKIDKLNYSGKE